MKTKKFRAQSVFVLATLFAFAWGSLLSSSTSHACTAFELPQSTVPTIAKSFDWIDGFGLILTNKRNVVKQALVAPDQGKPLTWKSRFGSVTFNQVGREFPYGGINERGLTVELLALESAAYPPVTDPRPAINDTQWIQYLLDSAASLPEAISLANATRLVPLAAIHLHYFVCDVSKDCAVFDSIDGKLVISAGNSLPIPVITNYTYPSSITNKTGVTFPNGAVDARFQVGAAWIQAYTPNQNPIEYAFKTLAAVAQTQGNWTKWNIVYQPTQNVLYLRSLQSQAIKRIDFSHFDFSCKTAALMLDINTTATGDVTSAFKPYDAAVDAANVRQAANHALPTNAVPAVLSYPGQFTRCME